jgi:hypothetical protein
MNGIATQSLEAEGTLSWSRNSFFLTRKTFLYSSAMLIHKLQSGTDQLAA